MKNFLFVDVFSLIIFISCLEFRQPLNSKYWVYFDHPHWQSGYPVIDSLSAENIIKVQPLIYNEEQFETPFNKKITE